MAVVKILVVTDDLGGFRRSNTASHKFHIGEFVQVLQDTDWQGFDVQITRAHRDSDPSPGTPAASHPIGADFYGFRFTSATLAGYDMVLFLSIASKAEDPVTSDTARRAEAAAVAAFMESGGGFFAVGDHEDLGASICQHIPRVRSMRRWAYSTTGPHGGAVAPSGIGADRHDTLRAGSDTGSSGGTVYPYQFNDQSDDQPQPINVRSYPLHSSRWFRTTLPHPLLCSPLGRVNVLPDHMHEGWCEVPSDLTQAEDLPGRAGKPEYPPGANGQPVAPEVIADATVLAHETLNQEFSGSFGLSPMTAHKSFGVIGAYDGHRAGVGRVVVDATWHHFVNINLIGTSFTTAGLDADKAKGFYSGPGNTAVAEYEKIKWYYRNIVYWLIPASRKRWILTSEFATALRLNPRWEEFKGSHYLDAARTFDLYDVIRWGQLAEEYFRTVRGYCVQFQLLPIILYPIWRFDPHIWEEWAPDLEPWNPQVGELAERIEAMPAWRQGLLPDASLRRKLLLGTLAIAIAQRVKPRQEVDEKTFFAVQESTLALLPRHLELAAKEIERSIELSHKLTGSFVALAEAAKRAVSATPPRTPAPGKSAMGKLPPVARTKPKRKATVA